MPVTRKQVRVSERQIALVLAAIAQVENWDAYHPSIARDGDSGWTFMAVNGLRVPAPSPALMSTIKGMK